MLVLWVAELNSGSSLTDRQTTDNMQPDKLISRDFHYLEDTVLFPWCLKKIGLIGDCYKIFKPSKLVTVYLLFHAGK